jgi:DNA-binding IclR family transcriptional regulator
MNTPKQTTNKPTLVETQQRLLQVVAYLGNNVVEGVTNGDIAKALNLQAPYVTRDLANAEAAGFAIYNQQTGRWSPGPALVEIAAKALTNIQRHRQKLDEMAQQYLPK